MDLTKISRFISLILRHKPEEIGIKLDEHGWAKVNELVRGVRVKYPDFNADILEEIVATDEKQRYSFDDTHKLVRANQGHSIPVDVELEQVEPPRYLYHGTATKYMDSIWKNGLVAKSRLYVHLSGDKNTAIDVGKRHGKPVVYRVRALDMHNQGFVFYRSENGVWLTERVPVEFLNPIFIVIPKGGSLIEFLEE
jgi:putative RNA 2'-phosphotransferase